MQNSTIITNFTSINACSFTGKEWCKSRWLAQRGLERGISETGFSYFGARYYDSDLSGLFLSVDPMADKYPSISPYAYCAWNPLKLVDPNGRDVEIVKDVESKTVTIRANFYYSKEQLGTEADVFLEGFKGALDSWSMDIKEALDDPSLGAEGFNIIFDFSFTETSNPESAAKKDNVGNWFTNDPEMSSSVTSTVIDNKNLRANLRAHSNGANQDAYDVLFYGNSEYQGALKHEIGHLLGLFDRYPQAKNSAPYIEKDLMSLDVPRNNAVEPFKRVWKSAGLDNSGSGRTIVSKKNREKKQ